MSACDDIFISRCKQLFAEGEEVPCRARWADGTQATTIHLTNVVNEYNVGKEFPFLTIRKVGLKAPVTEILWIFQKKSNKVADLGLHIWDQWADAEGTIGKAYGYQIGQRYCHHIMKDNPLDGNAMHEAIMNYPSIQYNCIEQGKTQVWLDQMDGVLWDLRNDDHSRRILTSTYNFGDLHEMGLYPCAFMTMWNVTGGKLNLLLVQRSQDILAASAFNVMEYSALLVMVAKATGHEVGKLTHVISDWHCYDRHIDIVKDIITRPTHAAPSVKFVNESTDFYSYKPSDFVVENYEYSSTIDKFEVAE